MTAGKYATSFGRQTWRTDNEAYTYTQHALGTVMLYKWRRQLYSDARDSAGNTGNLGIQAVHVANSLLREQLFPRLFIAGLPKLLEPRIGVWIRLA